MSDYEDTHLDTGGELAETPDLDTHGGDERISFVSKPWRCRCGKTGGEHSDSQWAACWPRVTLPVSK